MVVLLIFIQYIRQTGFSSLFHQENVPFRCFSSYMPGSFFVNKEKKQEKHLKFQLKGTCFN